jgi:gluconate kinase
MTKLVADVDLTSKYKALEFMWWAEETKTVYERYDDQEKHYIVKVYFDNLFDLLKWK